MGGAQWRRSHWPLRLPHPQARGRGPAPTRKFVPTKTSGGCGHEFNFKTLKPLGSGSPGNPANERQVNFAPKPMPKPKPNLPPTDAKVDPFDPRRAEEPPTDENLIIQELREVS